METTYSIDLAKDKSLYHFTAQDLPDNVIDDNLSDKAKGALESKIVQLTQNGGFVIVPSAQLVQTETEDTLKKSSDRQEILKSILTDKPVSGVLGLLSFKRDTIDKVQSINIESSKTLDIEDEYVEETLTIDLIDGLDSSVNDLNIDLNLFGLDASNASGIKGTGGTSSQEKMDIISEAVYYNVDGKEIHREFLIPETINHLSKNGSLVNVNNKGHEERTGRKKRKGGFLKRIKIFVRKLIGKVRQVIEELKDFGVEYIIKGLKKVIKNPYKILKYDTSKKRFFECSAGDIAPESRTLILLHGTLKGSFDGLFKRKKSKEGSFKYLYNAKFKNYKHWFDFLLNQEERALENPYEQILALEHETLLDDPAENARVFFEDLGLKNIIFKQPVSIVAASRGSLFAKHLSISPLASIMDIERVAIVSGGYSDYFDSKNGVKQYVNTMAKLFPMNKLLQLLLSLSLDIIISLPGLEVQNKDSERFKAIVKKRNNVCYFNMTNNYKARKLKERIFEKIADTFLGKENDMALSIFAQKDHRPGYIHARFPDFNRNERHGDALNVTAAKMALFYFLTEELNLPEDFTTLTV